MANTQEEKDEIQKHVRVVKDKLVKFLAKENPADVSIIKAHLICEYYLNQILIIKGICTAGDLNKLSFYDKNQKAFDMGNQKEKMSFDSLRILNKLRNKVGHELEYVLSESDVDTLGYVFGKDYIFEKYDFENLSDLLRNTLMQIVVDLALLVFDIISVQKKLAQA